MPRCVSPERSCGAVHLCSPFTGAGGRGGCPVVRFSGSSTNPALADLLSLAKGMAVQFVLPDGSFTNLVGTTVPVFFARTPESFLDIIRAAHRVQEGSVQLWDLITEISAHFAESKESLLAVKNLKPPASYGESRYYCIHAYFFTDREDNAHPVKFEWIPDAGVRTMSIIEAADQPSDYLEDELRLRLKEKPVVFMLTAILGEAGDPTNDPTCAWPDDRRRIDLGRLYISKIINEPADLFMDPTVISSGMALSDDPILNFRHVVYAESYQRRRDGR
ncbi:catalase [Paenibacillus foliorum]|uniref:catalase n=1 Tax=Paenibacillus foliorum TaxID=2654974 RepID=UPI001FEC5DD8|nr:catalase [Paenibacillus foliorum]